MMKRYTIVFVVVAALVVTYVCWPTTPEVQSVTLPDTAESYHEVAEALRSGDNIELRVPVRSEEGAQVVRDGKRLLSAKKYVSFGPLPGSYRTKIGRGLRSAVKSLAEQVEAFGQPEDPVELAKFHEANANLAMAMAQLDVFTNGEEFISTAAALVPGFYAAIAQITPFYVDPRTGLACNKSLLDEDGKGRDVLKYEKGHVIYLIDPEKYPDIDYHRAAAAETKQVEAQARVYSFNSLPHEKRKKLCDAYDASVIAFRSAKLAGDMDKFKVARKVMDKAKLVGLRIDSRTYLASPDPHWVGKHPYR